jgi:p-hydroxybenzoate 3-monooxygenase
VQVQVAIIGAGPAGMFLAHLLAQQGTRVIVLERQSRDYVQGRVRAGVLEPTTCDLMDALGLGERMRQEGLSHDGVNLQSGDQSLRIDLQQLTGCGITIYGQQEVMKDLFDAAPERDVQVEFKAADVRLHNVTARQPTVTWQKDGSDQQLTCDFIVGCDGAHGVSRQSIPATGLTRHERIYPFGWLGILVDVPPVHEELIYCQHANGFALASMRSPTRSRYYLQCPIDTRIEDWSDARFWDELAIRLGSAAGGKLTTGDSFEKSIAPLRSEVCEPMRYGNLFLAGDAAHIVPPTGAKGLNLAAADVATLARAFERYYHSASNDGLEQYSQDALARVWRAERFSWWLTRLTHVFPNDDSFDTRLQTAEIDYLCNSHAARASFAENYVGLAAHTDQRTQQ